MKKTILTGAIITFALFLATGSFAWWSSWRHSPGMMMGYTMTQNQEAAARFRSEAQPLRSKLIKKETELRMELVKPTPDPNRVSALRTEIITIEGKIRQLAVKYDVAMWDEDCDTSGTGTMSWGMMSGMHGKGYRCPW